MASSRVVSADTHRAVLLVRDLYDFSEILEKRGNSDDAWQYAGSKEELESCQKPAEALHLALQLSMKEPGSGSWGRARQLWETCLVKVHDPLLVGYIENELSHLQRLEETYAATLEMQASLVSKRRESDVLQNRLKTLQAKRAETSEPTATSAAPKEVGPESRAAEADSTTVELDARQAEVNSKDAMIRILTARIANLEAKLQSLTSIEQRLNQEELKQAP